jgi:hypothetical protein
VIGTEAKAKETPPRDAGGKAECLSRVRDAVTTGSSSGDKVGPPAPRIEYLPGMETPAGALLAEPAASLRLMSEQEFKLRQAEWQPEPSDPQHVLSASVTILELNLALAAINEAVHEVGAKTLAQALAQIDRIMTLAATIARLDLARVLEENAHLLPPLPPFWNHADRPAGVETSLVVRHVHSLVAYCPIEHLEAHAKQVSRPDLGHRCRVAYDALEAFVRRSGTPHDDVARTAGRAYAEGRLSLDEVCSLLGYDRSDAVAFLEGHGFCRNAEAISMREDERAHALEMIRQERLSRAKPGAVGLAEREVIASQRIEGVDARPWVPRS